MNLSTCEANGRLLTRKPLFLVCLIVTCVLGNQPQIALSEDAPAAPAKSTAPTAPIVPQNLGWKLTMKTLGGMQFWGDVHFFHEWRIQRNVYSGHYRLLDGNDNRLASGTLSVCRAKLDEVRKSRKLPPMSGKAVILLHGIIRSSKSMHVMRDPFVKAGYKVFLFNYPSTRVEIQESAEYLHRAIQSLEGIEQINFVAHSMGGLVVRAYLAKHHDKRICRMVMLGVPNLGAKMADRVKQLSLFRTIFGPAGQQLVSDPKGLIAKLPTPDFEFAVIAGARGTLSGFNPLVPGDDDGTVSVSSTRLPGAADFVTVPVIHSFIMNSTDAVDYSVRFIQTGQLREQGKPHPIPKPKTPPQSKPLTEPKTETETKQSDAAGT